MLQIAGTSISDQIKSNPLFEAKEYKVTTGGYSRFKYIVHMAASANVGFVHQDLEKVLIMIDKKLETNSVAIPAIGTGNVYFLLL